MTALGIILGILSGMTALAAIGGQFGKGTILIRRLKPQGEKSRGFSGHAFARVPALEWLASDGT